MTSNQREALELLWQLGASPVQIARQTGMPLATVCEHLAELSGRPDERPVDKQKRFDFDQPRRDAISDADSGHVLIMKMPWPDVPAGGGV